MTTIFTMPDPDLEDSEVIGEIQQIRRDLAAVLRAPRRWTGGLRRTATAQAIQGSNTIEGYTVSDEDAFAAIDDEPPLSADDVTWAEIIGYRRVLTFVLNVASEPGFEIDESTIRSMHFMLLEHDLSKAPGRYRTGPVYVHDDRNDRAVYEGPDATAVPSLMHQLEDQLRRGPSAEPLIRAAMAHLNLVMIHPFRDGNGRMARALQTMVLAQDQVLEPAFSSIEEWLGNNTDDYYEVLAAVGAGSWHPERDASLWVKFNLRAHFMQAQTVRSRFDEADRIWAGLDAMIARHRLPERVADALFDAALGLRVTRPSYVKRVGVEERTATRDLARLVELGLLSARGERRGRHYVGGSGVLDLRREVRSRRSPVADPYPSLMDEIRRTRSAGRG